MPKSLKLPELTPGRVAVLGFVAFLLFFGFIYLRSHQPDLVSIPARPEIDQGECDYPEKQQSAEQARLRFSDTYTYLSEEGRARELHRVEAAEKQQADARICEERLREKADLEAQWAAASAAKNAASVAAVQWKWAYFEFAALVLTIGAALAAAVEAGRAADEAEKGNGQNAEQSQRELRAYVGAREIRFEVHTEKGTGIARRTAENAHIIFNDFLVVVAKNFGQTPAHDTRNLVGVARLGFLERLAPKFDFDAHLKGSNSSLNSGAVLTRALLSSGQEEPLKSPFDPVNYWDAKDNKCSLLVFGRIYYRDAFNRPWSTKFCFMWEPFHPAGERFVPYDEFNGEDQEEYPE